MFLSSCYHIGLGQKGVEGQCELDLENDFYFLHILAVLFSLAEPSSSFNACEAPTMPIGMLFYIQFVLHA